MKYSTSNRNLLIYLILLVFLILQATCVAIVLKPEPGSRVKTDGGLTIDYSNINQGYVLIKCPAKSDSEKPDKVKVSKGKEQVHYNMNLNGEYEIIPLQFGNGKYTFQYYEHQYAKNYSLDGKIILTAKMPNENTVFLYPNQYVNFTEETEAVKKANELCDGITDPKKIIKNFHYDYIKAYTVKKGQLPDIDEAWTNKMGVCQDLSAIAVAMLRSQDVPAKLVIGSFHANNTTTYHAWVSVIFDGKEQRFDPTADIQKVKGTYTVERWY